MPAFVAALLGGLINIAGYLAGRVLLSLGFGVVVYTGISATLDYVKDQAISSISGLPSDMVQLLAYMKVGECISIITGALAVRMLMNGLSNGSIKRLVQQ